MTTNELKKLIESGDLKLIRFYSKFKLIEGTKPIWTVACYGSPAVFTFGHCLTNSSRERALKDFTSLDRAYAAMKNLGYKGRFEVDDSTTEING